MNLPSEYVSSTNLSSALIGLLLISGLSPCHAAQLYRWTDEHGKIFYGDQIPTRYIQQGYNVVSEQGITVYTIGPVSDEPIPEPKEEAPKFTTYERGLLATYSSGEEIELAKQKKLDDIDSIIGLTQDNIMLQERQFRELTKSAGDYERRGEHVPKRLEVDIANIQEKISNYARTIGQYEAQKLDASKRFDTDVELYLNARKRQQHFNQR